MKTFYIAVITMLFTSFQVSAQTWQWTKPEPNGNLGPNEERDEAHDVEIDASGNVYVLGDYLDSLFLNNIYRATGNGSYLAKYDSTGNLLWYRLIRPNSTSEGSIKATDLTVTAQGVFITGKYAASRYSYDCTNGQTSGGSFSYSIGNLNFTSQHTDIGFFVTKLNANGGVVWNRLATGSYCLVDDNGNPYGGFPSVVSYNPHITSDNNNNIICEFMYQHEDGHRTSLSIGSGIIPLPTPIPNVYNGTFIVFKMNNAGTLIWSNYAVEQQQSQAGNDCNSIITDNNGNVFLYGVANDGCAFGSNIYHTSEFLNSGNNSWSNFIAKISSTGVWQFSKELHSYNLAILQLGGGNPDKLAVDNANNVYAVVNLPANSNSRILGDTVAIDKTSSYLIKMSNIGNLLWYKGFGDVEGVVNSLHFANNALYISGNIRNSFGWGRKWYFSNLYVQPSSPNNIGMPYEYFISKANTDGNFLWATSFSGDPSYSLPEGFAVKAFGNNIYTSGYYRGNITSLGNLNGTYSDYFSGAHNLFFGKLKDQYIKVGAVSASQVVPGCNITIPFTSNGLTFSANNSFIAELSDINSEFTNPAVIGSVTSTGNGVINATIPASLPLGTSGYKIRIRSTDTLLTGLNYYAYADTTYTLKVLCPTPSAGFAATNITNSSATVNWATVACGAGYRIQYRVKGSGTWITATTLANNNISSFNLTGLTANTTYQWRIATRCRSNGVVSFSAYTTAKQFKTAVAFAVSGSNDLKVTPKLQLLIQPNPTVSNAVLSINGNVKNATVSIVDFVGKTVWKKDGVNAGQLTLPLQDFSAGIYLVKLVNGNETKIIKLVKQ